MRRGNVIFALSVAAVLAVVAIAYLLLLGPERAADPSAVVAPPASTSPARLTSAAGLVELRPAAGDWRPAIAGAEVGPDTALRTGSGGSAALQVGDGLTVEVSSDSEVRLAEVDETIAKLVVREGLVVGDVAGASGRRLVVGAEDSDAVAETTDGRLHVLADGEGNVQAAVTRGRATVTASGKSVELPAGYQTTIRSGEAPQTPMVLPASMLLKVKWPPHATTAKRRQLVAGTTAPGSRVRIGDTVVTADAKGEFRAVIELGEGSNVLQIKAVDIMGRTEEDRSPPILLDTSAPAHVIETDPGMWKKSKKNKP